MGIIDNGNNVKDVKKRAIISRLERCLQLNTLPAWPSTVFYTQRAHSYTTKEVILIMNNKMTI